MDGIEKDLGKQAQVIRLNLLSRLGRDLARRYGVRGVPTLIVFDGQGNVVDHRTGIPNRQETVERVNGLLTQH